MDKVVSQRRWPKDRHLAPERPEPQLSVAAQHDHQFADLLQTAWSRIQHVNPEVPDLRISLGTRVRDLHPVTVPPPGDDAAERIFSALLHEAAHGLASYRNLHATSRQGRYHNSTFKALSEELGLVVSRSPTLGWPRLNTDVP
ncbi:hypothetical protein [Microlunatus sp. GCM10028923]|uniref:hypothetical protein n=1 Tax=Microlunatus sp. GCM10028923 TaxID=3273400 RepID=UPI00361F57AB